MKAFSSLYDLTDVIVETLGDFADHYDVEGIARDISEWRDGRLVADLERADYWEIVADHDISAL